MSTRRTSVTGALLLRGGESTESLSEGEKRLGILCGLIYYLLLGLEHTSMTSFFSVEADKRNLTTAETGVIFSTMEVSSFFTSFFVMYFITPKTQTKLCVLGIFITAIASVTYSILEWVHTRNLFLFISITLETFIGMGASMSLTTVIPIITSLSVRKAGKIISFAEALLSFGSLLGPPIGSVLYSYFGFCGPNFLTGGLLFMCGLFSVYFFKSERVIQSVRNSDDDQINSNDYDSHLMGNCSTRIDTRPDSNELSVSLFRRSFDPFAYMKFISRPNLLIVSTLAMLTEAQMLFFDVCLPLYLRDTFQLSTVQTGLMFSVYAISNVGMTPIYGVAVDRGYAIHVTLFSAIGFSITFAALYFPKLYPDDLENLWFLAICFFIAGFFAAGAFVPAYLIYEKIAEVNGFENTAQKKLMVATWSNNSAAIGAFIGSVALGGPIFENVGFNTTCLIISISMISCIVLSLGSVQSMDLFAKMYYVEDDDTDDDGQENLSDSESSTYDNIR